MNRNKLNISHGNPFIYPLTSRLHWGNVLTGFLEILPLLFNGKIVEMSNVFVQSP